MLSDIEIAESAELLNIKEIAKKLNISEADLSLYGDKVAKIKKLSKLHKFWCAWQACACNSHEPNKIRNR